MQHAQICFLEQIWCALGAIKSEARDGAGDAPTEPRKGNGRDARGRATLDPSRQESAERDSQQNRRLDANVHPKGGCSEDG